MTTRTEQGGARRALIIAAGLATVAGTTMPGCGGKFFQRFRTQAEDTTPKPEPIWKTTPTTTASLSAEPGFGSTTDTFNGTQPAYDLSDSWSFVESATLAERLTPTSRVNPVSLDEAGAPSGPDLAAHLYGHVLDMELPTEPGTNQIEQTVNIRQVSFSHEGSNFDPIVTHDGSRLIFASTQHRPTSDIYIQNVNSRVLTRLTQDPAHDVMPDVSPDGQRLAFSSNRTGSWDLYVMPIGGGKAIQLTNDSAHDIHPTWSPDGSKLVFSRLGQTSGRWELWVVDVFNVTNTQFIGYGLFPEWAPVAGTGLNGADQIMFQRSRERGERTFSVWTLDFNELTRQAGNETELVSSPSHALINPAWSPDATRIVYAAVPNPESWEGGTSKPESSALWMIGIDGRGQVNLTGGGSIDLMPAWSPTGNVFFVSNRSGVENLWSLEVAPAIMAATGIDPYQDQRLTVQPGFPNGLPGPTGNPASNVQQPTYVNVPTNPE